jgi:hypothetical protein
MVERTDYLNALRHWWNGGNAKQRADALRMYVGPTIETVNGVKDIRTVAELSFEEVDQITVERLIDMSMTIPNFLD